MSRGSQTPTCTCAAYPYPHRFLAGKCDGSQAVEAVLEKGAACQHCPWLYTTKEPHGEVLNNCALLERYDAGKEFDPASCPGISDFVKGL